ncbi:MAG: quaternary amine ABC transporter ATP-binding protein [Syntrophomonadaceae bacterium]|jgi:glycine betaine/proline transport system ATP-binding protein|nr:betaine/proline/choline family ABC transporter ATP-binding protein [Bacillota bacterium]NLM88660.1 betaine/proline/choline family ABC transporter ATP-binding protein [Syntrophomonadaceae bacterium]HAA09138.1 ABC transporter ATP-binding protein [Syntrophomonas sp.]HQA50390.1 betaine/proline/choline family ABC transporter ATP-binding protein [Syntrophomonadaceae bacterium]HQD91005.1 betaine/proline/choline family ABC transporter ATP-binding protein [Syntrophomonadaceae bacterium]
MTDANCSDTLVEINGLWKVFTDRPVDFDLQYEDAMENLEDNGAVVAVRDVSFQVKRGEVFVIMGLSGSGKSTLIRCISRLVEPTQGEIIVKGQNVLEMDEQQLLEFRRYETAMVFQHYGLLPHRNVIENVAFGLKLRGVSERERNERARTAIARVGLEGWENHYPSQLSGGMRQRVGIARALVQETDLLLMDEPFSGLDPLIRREMQDTLIRLQKEVNKTIVFVTHDLGEAIRLGDRMAVMRQGQFVQQGTPEEIMNNPADEYVERFVADERALLSGKGRQPVYFPSKSRLTKKAKSTSPSAPLAAAGAEVK